MCQDCGCSIVSDVAINGEIQSTPDLVHLTPNHTHTHHHHHHDSDEIGHSHSHSTSSAEVASRTLAIHESLLSKNDRLAERNRGYFQAKGVFVLNILSSPGSGKTALIERMIRDQGDRSSSTSHSLNIGVIVGDLETDNDAQRLRQAGAPAVQITTGHACHLEADMIARAMTKLDLDSLNLLIIENVGNLVCPAAYDLGESSRVVLLSVTEGEDKPLKYPTMFKTADVVLITKIDIADAVGFNRELAIANIQRVAPQTKILEVSARTGVGMDAWYQSLAAGLSTPIAQFETSGT